MTNDGLKVFILGSARSGTSITYYAMREVFDLPGRGESHVFPLFQRLLHQFYSYSKELGEIGGVLAGELDTRSFRRHLYEFISAFYLSTYKDSGWVDKTPGSEALMGVTLIREVFPDARIIVTKRSGIEVVQSFQTKFGSSFSEACKVWARCAALTVKMRDTLPDVLFVDQFDLTNRTDVVAEEIAQYLCQPERAATLVEFFRVRRTDQLSNHDWRRQLTLSAVDWDNAHKAEFELECGEQMAALGYPM